MYKILKKYSIFLYLTWFTRILLAIGFIPSGYKKLVGERFTLLDLDNPVGFFFEGMYRTGFYWNFLGLMQITAAVLLVIPRTSFFGALLYLPIITNIFIIVTAMKFVGTPVVAGLMLLANIYLLIWDIDKMKNIVRIIFQD